MSSIRFAAAALVALSAASVGQAAIVVASSGPSAGSFPAGRKLDENASITLRAGDSVTILDARGTRVVRGAGTFAVSQQAGASRASTFAVLTRQNAAQRVRTGAVRDPGATGPVRSPNLWYVDVAKEGTVCVVDTANVSLWRENAASAVPYSVTSGTVSAPANFAAGAMVAPWNTARAPVRDGATFRLSSDGGKTGRTIKFAVLPAAPANAEALAAALIERGCTAQLDLLAVSTAR